MLIAFPSAFAVELDERGRWVEEATVELDGATVVLRRGILFPLVDAVGFVYVGDGALTTPLSEGASLAVRAVVPDVPPGRSWTEDVERVVAIGTSFADEASLGHPLGDDPDAVSWRDEHGREQVEVTALRPRNALSRARAALAARTTALAEVGLDPDRMLALEADREGPPRAIVEAEPAHDVRALFTDDRAELVPPWLTWVVDPSGVVDDRHGAVLALHGPTPDGRAWQVLSGVVRVGAPEVTVVRGTANAVLERGPGVAAIVRTEAQLELVTRGRLVDLWIPETPTSTMQGAVAVGGALAFDRLEARAGGVPVGVEVLGTAWGPRRPRPAHSGYTLRLAEPVTGPLTLRVDTREALDVGRVLLVVEWVLGSIVDVLPGHEWDDLLQGVPEVMTLGRVIPERPVLPIVVADPRPYPAELRAGTAVIGWRMTAGAAADATEVQDGRLWTASVPSTTTFSGGELEESRDRPALGLPGVRLLTHGFVDQRLPERVRSVLNFYAPALPPWPYGEVVIVQAPDRPVITGPVRTDVDVRDVVPEVRSAGGGQIVLENLVDVPLGALALGELESIVDGQWPHAAERALAEALAAGWWEALPWSEHDRWLARALPAVYRDRFVAEAWDEDVEQRWATFADERIALGPSGEVAPFADAAWAGELGARLIGGAIRARIGEEAMLEGLDAFLVRGEPTLERLVGALEEAGGVGLRGTFDAFVVAGLRPRIDGTLVRDGDQVVVELVATPPLGTYDVPVVVEGRKDRTVAWVRVVDGRGAAELPARGMVAVEIDPERWLPVRGGRIPGDVAERR